MSDPDKAPVDVIIVTWNCRKFLDGCLSSLMNLERIPESIVIVDNGSSDGTLDFLRQNFPGIGLVENGENLGFCRANNIGIRETASEFVLVLNPDTKLEPDFLEELLPAFEDDRVGMAAGKMLRFDGLTIDTAGQQLARSRQPLDRGYGRPDSGRFDHDHDVFGACAAAALYRREMLEQVAVGDGEYFDERYFAFYEDLDLAWRAHRAGYKAAYRHRAVGYHARGGTSSGGMLVRRLASMLGRSVLIRYHIVKNRYLTILRNDSPSSYLSNLPWILARDAATLLILLLTSPSVLGMLWRNRRLFREVLQGRKLDAGVSGNKTQQGEQ